MKKTLIKEKLLKRVFYEIKIKIIATVFYRLITDKILNVKSD